MKIKYAIFAMCALASSSYALDSVKVGDFSDTSTWSGGGLPSSTIGAVLGNACAPGQYYSISQNLSLIQINSGWGTGNYNVRFIETDGVMPIVTLLANDDTNGVIAMRGGAGGTSAVSQNLTFENGIFDIVNNPGKTYTKINLGINSTGTSTGNHNIEKTLTFGADVVMNAATNVQFDVMQSNSGTTSYSESTRAKNKVDFNGTYTSGSTNNVSVWGLTLNVGATGKMNMGQLKIENYGAMNINGEVTVAPTGLASSSVALTVAANSVMNINNKLTVNSSGSTHNMLVAGSVKVAAGGTFVSSGGWGTVVVANGGVLEINSAENSFRVDGVMRMRQGGKLILNSTNAYWGNFNPQRSRSLWLSNASTESDKAMIYLEVNAYNQLGGFCFGTNATDTFAPELTVTLGDGDGVLLELAKLSTSLDSDKGYLMGDARLVFVNFRNGAVKVDEIRAGTTIGDITYEDDLSLISAEGYENFRLEAIDGGSGYLLVADAIPEPATIAAIFGALALGFAVLRRNRK